EVLTLVVLVETYTEETDVFETKEGIQYRELRIENGVYKVQLWRAKDANSSDFVEYEEPYYPKDGAGNSLTEIPFTFIGSKNNEPSIDSPPMYDMADINVAHYRNSADYEESVFVVGQP